MRRGHAAIQPVAGRSAGALQAVFRPCGGAVAEQQVFQIQGVPAVQAAGHGWRGVRGAQRGDHVHGHQGGRQAAGHFDIRVCEGGVDPHTQVVVPHAQVLAVPQFMLRTDADRGGGAIDVDPIGAGVLQVIAPVAAVDAGVVAGNVALGVGQDPVIVVCAADAPAAHAEHRPGVFAQAVPLVTDDLQAQRHELPCPAYNASPPVSRLPVRVLMSSQHIFKILFVNQGKVYEVYARKVSAGDLFGFIEVEELVFGERAGIVVDPAEERIKSEFEGVKRSYLPMHSVLRIDEVSKRGTSKITQYDGNVTPFPSSVYAPPTGDPGRKP